MKEKVELDLGPVCYLTAVKYYVRMHQVGWWLLRALIQLQVGRLHGVVDQCTRSRDTAARTYRTDNDIRDIIIETIYIIYYIRCTYTY